MYHVYYIQDLLSKVRTACTLFDERGVQVARGDDYTNLVLDDAHTTKASSTQRISSFEFSRVVESFFLHRTNSKSAS